MSDEKMNNDSAVENTTQIIPRGEVNILVTDEDKTGEDLLAMSDPERALRIAERLGKEDQSPLVYLVTTLTKYLKKVIKANDLKPSRSVDEMMQFVIVTYQGIQSGFVLAECFKTPQLNNKYKPKKMFSCLAESLICMMEGKNE